MLFQAVGQHHLLDGAALLGDFQLAVAVGPLKGDMQFAQQFVLLRVLEAQLLRENQRTAGQQGLANPREQFEALFGRNKLQGEVQRHQGAGLQGQGEDIGLDHLHRQQFLKHRVLGVQIFPAALDHGAGIVHGDHPAILDLHMAAQGLGHRAQGAA